MAARTRVGMVIPAFNEEAALPRVLDELPRERVDALVVVDNGSTDRTAEVAQAAGATVVREERRGYGQACLTGIAALLDAATAPGGEALDDSDVIVFLDADHSDYPDDLHVVLEPILGGDADLSIGSRILGGADMGALLPQAWFGNRLACLLMRVLFRARYTDLGPFRALRVSSLKELEMRDRDFGWTVEMQLKAKSYGLRTIEVPVRYRRRIGESKITGTVTGTVRAGFKILGWILTWRLRLLLPRATRPRSPERARDGS